MKEVYFHLPGVFEHYKIYKFLIPIFKNERNKFYDYVNIGSIYGENSLAIWSGGHINYNYSSLPYDTIKKFYDDNDISISIVASNLLLDGEDLFDSITNFFVNSYHESKNEIIIGSDILKKLVDILYPNYKKISSSNKFLSKEDTIKELDNGYDRIILNVTLNNDFDFLNNLTDKQKKKIEIIVNPTCLNFCGHYKEHYEAISHDIIHRDKSALKFKCEWQSKNFIEKINSDYTIKNNELLEKYINAGFNNFRIIDGNSSYIDTIYFLVYYLVKPEYYLDITYQILTQIKKWEARFSNQNIGEMYG